MDYPEINFRFLVYASWMAFHLSKSGWYGTLFFSLLQEKTEKKFFMKNQQFKLQLYFKALQNQPAIRFVFWFAPSSFTNTSRNISDSSNFTEKNLCLYFGSFSMALLLGQEQLFLVVLIWTICTCINLSQPTFQSLEDLEVMFGWIWRRK